jgi:predicted PurR-regulated permease PerM
VKLHQPDWTRLLTILLVILATYAILYVTLALVLRFTQAILLFVSGAILAYVLMPLVNRLNHAFRLRWLAILTTYAMIAIGLFALGYSLFTPFVEQSKSLVENLHTPDARSLVTIKRLERDTLALQTSLKGLPGQIVVGQPPGAALQVKLETTLEDIHTLQSDVLDVRRRILSGPHRGPRVPQGKGRLPPNPEPQTEVPPSYLLPVDTQIKHLQTDYSRAIRNSSSVDPTLLSRAVDDASRAHSASRQLYATVSSTPILLLRFQFWLDQRNIKVDLHSKFGQAANQVSNQGSDILNNAITIVQETFNALLDITLILIIAFYFLLDGPRMTRRAVQLVPATYRDQARFFVASLDSVLGGYIRGQLFLSVLAGILGGGGAAALGVPYPLLIGIVTALLQLVPVIGPMVAVVPALLISLFFMPLAATIALVVWYLVFQQVVTNVIGPRVMGAAVGIHPLEALLAVVVGYPLGGLLGAFLAVPVMGIVHILLRESYDYFVVGMLPGVEPVGEPVVAAPRAPGAHPVPRSAGPDPAAQ